MTVLSVTVMETLSVQHASVRTICECEVIQVVGVVQYSSLASNLTVSGVLVAARRH